MRAGGAEITREEHQLTITAAQLQAQGLSTKPKHELYHALFTTALCSLPLILSRPPAALTGEQPTAGDGPVSGKDEMAQGGGPKP